MLPALARLSASIMISSSIRLRFGGEHVDCTMKQVTPRTFSPISTKISPSEKRSTRAFPVGISTVAHSSAANGGFEFPLKMARVLFKAGSSGSGLREE
jgi:hypothetical protein